MIEILNQVGLFVVFLIVCLVTFTAIGWWFLRLFKQIFSSRLEQFLIASCLGFVIFTLTSYLLTAFGLSVFLWGFPLLGLFVFFTHLPVDKSSLIKIWGVRQISIRKNWVFLSVITLGIIGQVMVNAPSGFKYMDGVYFWSSHGHDGVWHIALMEEISKKQWPIMNPELVGQKLVNYHFFSDLLMSDLGSMFGFSYFDIYFRFMPIVNSLLLGLGSYVLLKKIAGTHLAGIWGMIFVYFCGSFGYIVTLPRNGNIVGESVFWVSQTQSVLGNPPHAMAFIILITFLIVLKNWFDKKNIGLGLTMIILGGALIEFKVYGGLLVLGGLMVVGFFEFIQRRGWQTFIVFLLTLGLSLTIYLPNSMGSHGFLVWHPWWFIRTMIVAPDRLNMLDWELRRQTYIFENNWKRVIWLESIGFFIFLFGNLGMRVIGFWQFIRSFRTMFSNYFNLFFVVITIASFVIPLFFLQKAVAWNIIQFNQYFLLLFGFWAAWSVSAISDRIKWSWLKWLLAVVIIVFAVPTQIGLLWQFYSNKPLSLVSNKEIEVLNFLRSNSQEDAVVLTKNFNQYEKTRYEDPPIPIYAWYDTGYIGAFSGRQTLISDTEQIDIMGYDVDELRKKREDIFETNDPQEVNNFFNIYNVDYVYLVYDQNFNVSLGDLDMALIAGNSDARLYKVQK